MKKVFVFIILIILPLVFQTLGLSFERAKYSNDPEYIYLMNALSITRGKAVGHVDNPGTPVMELNAVILNVYHLFDFETEDSLLTSVIKDPDKYVAMLSKVFIFLNAIIIFWIGFVVFKRTQNLWLSLLFQLTPFFSLNLLEHLWTKISPEPVLFMVTGLLIIVLIRFYYDANDRKWMYVILFSVVSGLGLATKATYLPLVIIPFIILPGLIRKGAYVIGLVASFVLFTLPAAPEYSHMFDWFYNLSTHSGVYGSGEKNFIDLNEYTASFIEIFKANILFSLIIIASVLRIVLAIIIPAVRKTNIRTKHFRILIALTIAMAGGILMVAKHYHANHYLIPVLSLIGLILFFNLKLLETLFSKRFLYKIISPTFVIVCFLVLPVWHYPTYSFSNFLYASTNKEYNHINHLLDNEFKDYTRVIYYPGSLNKYSALRFGGAYSKNKNLVQVKMVYPEVYFYDLRYNQFTNWEAQTTLSEIAGNHGKKIILVGGPIQPSRKNTIVQAGYLLTEKYIGRTQALYVFDSTAIQASSDLGLPDSSVHCSFEELSENIELFVCRGATFKGAKNKSSEQVRTGEHSIKLDRNNAFSMEYNLANALPGEKYRISIWRYADSNEGHLVAASSPEAVFYQQANDFLEVDDSGWQKLVLKFDVPANLGENQLKIYIWNSGKSDMYFDDLLIEKWNSLPGGEN